MALAFALTTSSFIPRRSRRSCHVCHHPRAVRCRLEDGGDEAEQYDSREAALARWNHAEKNSPGGAEGFHARLGGGVAASIGTVYPEEARLLVVCGKGRNGSVGLHTAAALAARGHSVCAYLAAERLPEAVERSGVMHVSFMPSTADYYWDVCIDAVMGLEYDGEPIRDSATWVPFSFVIRTKLPVASVDVPSGWHVDNGPSDQDRATDDFVKPRMLISLGRPKKCARHFGGALHYVFDWESKSKDGSGKQGEPELFASNARSFMGANGEVYGRPGMFQATLFTKRESRRTWVYPESGDAADDVWDEID